MADPRDPYGGNRDNRPPDQDTGSLLRDLRSLREAASPRPGVARPSPGAPAPKGGSPGLLIGGVLVAVVLVVGLAGYNAGVFDHSKPVNIGVSPRPADSPAPSASSSLASAAPTTGTTAVRAPASPTGPAPLAQGLVPGRLGLQYALASFLLSRYDPAVKPADRFAQGTSTELLAPSGGPAVWFAREARSFPDELSVVSAAATAACTGPDPDRRTQVLEALVRLTTLPASPIDRAYGLIATGFVHEATVGLPGGATMTDRPLVLALASALQGAAPAAVDKILTDSPKQSGLTLALRAHLAVMLEKREDALRLVTEAGAAASVPDELFLAAGLAFRMGEYRIAGGLLERAGTMVPGDPYSIYWRALIDEKQGRADQALKKYSDALRACADPKLLAAARIRRALLHQKAGNAPEVADLEWKGAEDYEPQSLGVWIAHAQSMHHEAEQSKGTERVQRFQETLDRWQRLIVVYGPQDDYLTRFVSCYDELKDQGNAREGIQLLTLLTDFGYLGDSPIKGKVQQTVDLLKDRVRPRAIWEAPPK